MIRLSQTQKTNGWQNSINFRINTPQGVAYIQIIEKNVGEIDQLIFHIGKGGSIINAMCFTIAEMATLLLKGGKSITEVIITLSGITADKSTKDKGVEITNPAEALMVGLMRYRSSIPMELGREKLGRSLRRVR